TGTIVRPKSASNSANSAILCWLREAKTILRTRPSPNLGGIGSQNFFLQSNQLGDSLLGQSQQLAQLLLSKRILFCGSLNFDHSVTGGHHEIHIDLSHRILSIVEVQERHSLY